MQSESATKTPSQFIRSTARAKRLRAQPPTAHRSAQVGKLPGNQIELYEELDATEERYVRKKLALEGYVGWQKSVAQHWLDDREARRQEAVEQDRSLWLRMGAYAAVAGVFAAIALKLLPVV